MNNLNIQNFFKRYIFILGCIFGAPFIATAATGNLSIFHLLIFAIPCFFVALKVRLIYLMYAIVLSLFSLDWMSDTLQILPRGVTWLTDILILAVIVRAFLPGVKKQLNITFMHVWVMLLIFVILLSIVLNSESILMLLPALKVYMKIPLLFVALLILAPSSDDINRVSGLLFGCILIQAPISVIQALMYGGVGDSAGGTLGINSTGYLAIVCLIFICYFLNEYFVTKDKKHLLWVVIAFVPAIAGSTKFSFLVMPIIVLLFLILNTKNVRNLAGNLFSVLILAFIFMLFIQIFDSFDKGYISEWIANPQGALDYEKRVSSGDGNIGGRLGSLSYVFDIVSNDWKHIVFGFGASSTAESFLGREFESYVYSIGMFPYSMPSFQRILAELGGLGVLLYLSLIVYLLWCSKKLNNYPLTINLALVIIFGSFYSQTFVIDVTSFCIFYLIYLAIRKKQAIEQDVIAIKGNI